MRRLRESWLALGGSALIIALSVSSALGAGSAQDTFDNIGQQVSELAQTLNGQNQNGDEPDADEQPDLEEDEALDEADEDAVDTDDDTLGDDEEADEADEEADAELAIGEEGFDWTTVSHGVCVSWHAHQDETAETDEETTDETDADAVDADAELVPGDEGYDWSNHGEFVSYWARIGCNESPDDAEEADEADDEADEDVVADEDLQPGDEDFDWSTVSHGFCVSWHAHQDEADEENAPEDGAEWKNHGEFVSHWARVGCNGADEADEDADEADEEADEEEDADAKAERRAEREAEKAERKAQREAARAERERNSGNGNGNGRGRGRP